MTELLAVPMPQGVSAELLANCAADGFLVIASSSMGQMLPGSM